jgi:hypothetical protein
MGEERHPTRHHEEMRATVRTRKRFIQLGYQRTHFRARRLKKLKFTLASSGETSFGQGRKASGI